jgi:hypothetical protein
MGLSILSAPLYNIHLYSLLLNEFNQSVQKILASQSQFKKQLTFDVLESL